MYGYADKILDVNLSSQEILPRNLDFALTDRFLGGGGIGSKILFDEVGPKVDPLGEENLLIISTGPLTGSPAPGSSRVELTSKSPLTGIMGSSNVGGFWGSALKRAGFDVIVIRGSLSEPMYLWIDDESVQLCDAKHLWGIDTFETRKTLSKELGSSSYDINVMTIGPAGERLVKFAAIIVDDFHAAARTGLGAVMGSKKLKAIAVRGTGQISIADPDGAKKFAREANERIREDPSYKEHRMYGALGAARANMEAGSLEGLNYQTAELDDWEKRTAEEAIKTIKADNQFCYSCPIGCLHTVELPQKGKHQPTKIGSVSFVHPIFQWGARCGIKELHSIWRCKEMCHRLGLDQASTANCIAFTMELIQRNILSKVDVDGLDMTWGNEETVFEMIHKIAYRDGFGDILAEGTARASKKIGKNSDRYVMAIKKMEIGSSADPRASPRGWILGKLTSPRGGDNIRTTHMKADRMPSKSTLKEMGMTETDYTKWFISRLDMFDDTKSKIYGDPPKLSPYSFEGKPYLAKWFEDLYAALSALGVCIFPAGFVGMLGPTYYSKLLEACTGKKVSAKELMLVGERIFNLQRMYLAREGLTRKEDRFPSRFYREPLSGGPKNGATLSEEEVNKALDEYYEIRGWDPKTGHVTEAKIQELGLIEAVDRR